MEKGGGQLEVPLEKLAQHMVSAVSLKLMITYNVSIQLAFSEYPFILPKRRAKK